MRVLAALMLACCALSFCAPKVQAQWQAANGRPSEQSWEAIIRRLEAAERTNEQLTQRLTHAEQTVAGLQQESLFTPVAEPLAMEAVDPPELRPVSFCRDNSGGCSCGQCGCEPAGCGEGCNLSADGCSKSGIKAGDFTIVPFGFLTGEVISSEAVTTARPMILYLGSPIAGADQEQMTIHGQTTALGFNFRGPQVGDARLGGMILFNFLGSRPVLNQATPFFLRGYGELAGDDWHFRFGQQGDLFNPLDPTTVNFGGNKQAGNGGAFRGSLRAARFIQAADDVRWSFEAAVSQQAVNDFIIDPRIVGADNGLPNVEGRIGVGIGPVMGKRRAVEVGVSGVVGETRSIGLAQVVSDTWGVSVDASWSCEYFGFNGEFLTGEAIGTYNAGIGQSLNPITLDAIATRAAWGEFWLKLTDQLTFHSGYGVDNPRDEDLGQFLGPAPGFAPVAGQRSRNEVCWANLICAVSSNLDVGFEVSYRETDYIAPSISNEGVIYHLRTRIRF